MIFKQIKVRGDNFSYLIGDENSALAAVIDPSGYQEEIDRLLREKGLKLIYIFLTHSHPDHVGGIEYLVRRTGASVVAHRSSTIRKDIAAEDGQVFRIGGLALRVMHTPGHSPDGICIVAGNNVMTGDTLFVRECGRTDLAGGNPEELYRSLQKLKSLPDDMKVWPGHDYGPYPSSTIGDEKKNNYTLEDMSLEEFVEFMREP